MKTKILLTGGGTSGHTLPIISICQTLQSNKRAEYFFVGTAKEKEIANKYGIPFKKIITGKRRNYFSISNFIDLFLIFLGIIMSFFIVLFNKPTVIFAKGGYVTFPVIFWAKIFKIPLYLHESDSVIGKANLWALKSAKKICLGFPLKHYENLDLSKAVYTGTPVRKEFFIDTKNQPKSILVTGGSQGSRAINKIINEILPQLTEKYSVVHIYGEGNLNDVKFKHPNYHPISYTNDMAKLMAAAGLIISRSGANTLAEISALGKPSILIPLPMSQSNHQYLNAKIYQENNAAVLLTEKNLTSSALLDIINRLMEDEKTLELLGHHARQFIKRESAQEIVDTLFEKDNYER